MSAAATSRKVEPTPIDNGVADRVIAFIERHCRLESETPGQPWIPFELADWQRDYLRDLYQRNADGFKHTRGLISVAKKNGKTGLAAALMLAYLAGPLARTSARYYSIAGGNKEQAGELFQAMSDMIGRNPELQRRLEVNRRMVILHRELLCSYRALPTNAAGIHGVIPGCWVFDELAQAADFKGYDALDRAQGTEPNVMGLVISTMSDAPQNPMAELVQSVTEGQKNGIMQHWCVRVYQADAERDIYDLDNVLRANPSVGRFLSLDAVKREIEEAKIMSSRRSGYLAYRLNIDAGVESALISVPAWQRCGYEIDRDQLIGERCYAGLDLSSSQDLTAFALWFPEQSVLICDAWLPRDTLAEREEEDHAPYRTWAADGWLSVCDGATIDKGQVLRAVQAAAERYDLMEVRYDAWRIDELRAEATREGWTLPPMSAVRQGYVTFGPIIDEFERLVLSEELRHEDNPVLNMCVRNTTASIDPRSTNNERRPAKVKPTARIDCAVASLMAIAIGDAATAPRAARDLILTELY